MKKIFTVGCVVLTLFFAGCSNQVNGNAEVNSSKQNEVGSLIPNRTLVNVEKVETVILESFPVQVNFVVSGHFRNGCEQFGRIRQMKRGNQIRVTIYAREVGEVCTQALVPFEEPVRLVFKNLKPGRYTVTVNGVHDDFKID